MKIHMTLACALFLSATAYAKPITSKSSSSEQIGYSFGYLMGRSNADSLKDLNLEALIQGLREAAQGKDATLSDEEMARVLTQYKKQAEAQQLIELRKKAEENSKIGAAFLAENATKAGVQTTASGLQYQVLKAGIGKTPKISSKVKVDYEGRLIDGTVFDSSIARQHPAEFQVNQVIQGWTEGLQLMKEGAKYRFFIPSNLAYGQIGSGDIIEPNSTLIFDVELLQVLP